MRDDNVPMRLYRYVPLSAEHGPSAVENAILHHRLYWPSPIAFNDPFDCNPVLIHGVDARERRAFAKRVLKEHDRNPRHIRRQNRKRLTHFGSRPNAPELLRIWQDHRERAALLSFSAVSDHPLMWAHYADAHRGVALIFEEQVRPRWIALAVGYKIERPVLNLTRIRDEDQLQAALLTKSSHWSYEEEFRMVTTGEKIGYNEFPEGALKGLILGARISAEHRIFVEGLTAKRPQLEVWDAEMHPSEYRLVIRKRAESKEACLSI